MPTHAAQSGSAVGGAIEGFLSGFQTGTNLRRERTFDQQDAEEIRRRRIAEEITAGRQEVTDQQTAARAAREEDSFNIERHEEGIERVPEGVPQAGTAAEGVPQPVLDLRSGVGANIDPSNAPPGFRRFAPSPPRPRPTWRPSPAGSARATGSISWPRRPRPARAPRSASRSSIPGSSPRTWTHAPPSPSTWFG